MCKEFIMEITSIHGSSINLIPSKKKKCQSVKVNPSKKSKKRKLTKSNPPEKWKKG